MATTCGVIRWKCARPRFEVCWPKLALDCTSTSICKAMVRPSSPMPASLALRASCQSARIPPTAPAARRLAQNEEPGCTGRKAGRRRGLGKRAVTEFERKHLVETDRHIAECKEYIAKQRELIERAIQLGRSTEVAETTLEALEASLREFEKRRRLLSKSASDDHHRQEPDHDLWPED